jgi:seryl-tRNA synthetase
MLDIQLIRENTEKVKKGVASKGYDASLVEKVLNLDEHYRKLLVEVEKLRAERNKISHEGKPHSAEASRGREIKKELAKKEPTLEEAEKELKEILFAVPNLPADDVPEGKNEKENKEVRKNGDPKKFDFTPKDHLELGRNLGILDFESGAKVAGSQFYYLIGDGALLELALVQYALEKLSQKGFTPMITPDLAKSRFYLGTGYSPKGDEAQTYEIKDQDLGLIATAEVTLAGKHADEIIPEDKLPLKYAGYSHCFRQESGAYGKYSKGLYRVHQFTKVEMFIYCQPEESEKYLQEILKMEEEICKELGLPYRVVEMCTGDLGAMAAKKYDVEVWMPGRENYGEVTSASNCTDYQARNLNIKFRNKNGENRYVHMINGTAIATSRIPLAILENYQQKDGSVLIPEVLQKWMGKKKITVSKLG